MKSLCVEIRGTHRDGASFVEHVEPCELEGRLRRLYARRSIATARFGGNVVGEVGEHPEGRGRRWWWCETDASKVE